MLGVFSAEEEMRKGHLKLWVAFKKLMRHIPYFLIGRICAVSVEPALIDFSLTYCAHIPKGLGVVYMEYHVGVVLLKLCIKLVQSRVIKITAKGLKRSWLTLYKLDKIMNGDIQEIIDACITADQAAKLVKMNEQP